MHDCVNMQVPRLREALLKQGNWQQIANKQRKGCFSKAASSQSSKSQMDEMLKALDFMCNLQPDKPQHPVSFARHCASALFHLLECALTPVKLQHPVSFAMLLYYCLA